MGEPPGRRGEALAPESSLESNEPRSRRTGHEFRLDRDRSPERRNRGMTSASRGGAPRVGPVCLLLLAILGACTNDSDLRGTYDVELRVQRIGVPIRGTLVLGSRSLEMNDPIWIVPNTRGGGAIDDEDDLLLDPNSCLVLTSARSETPHAVMLFEIRSGAEGIELPFGLFDSGKERIEVTDLKLFADALSGDLVYTDANGNGEGRLYGDRKGDPDGDACIRSLARFVEALEAQGAPPSGERDPR